MPLLSPFLCIRMLGTSRFFSSWDIYLLTATHASELTTTRQHHTARTSRGDGTDASVFVSRMRIFGQATVLRSVASLSQESLPGPSRHASPRHRKRSAPASRCADQVGAFGRTMLHNRGAGGRKQYKWMQSASLGFKEFFSTQICLKIVRLAAFRNFSSPAAGR